FALTGVSEVWLDIHSAITPDLREREKRRKRSSRLPARQRRGIADGGDVGAIVAAALEHRRARDQHVGADARHQRRDLPRHPRPPQRGRVPPVMPPCTSTSIAPAPMSARSREIFSAANGMKVWPPKPGLTDITRMRSTRSRSGSTALSGVPGLRATPAFLPSARVACSG